VHINQLFAISSNTATI